MKSNAFEKRFGLTQREVGAILGGGPNAFQKYEQDTVTVSKPMSNLLRVLERHPEEVEELKKQAEVAYWIPAFAGMSGVGGALKSTTWMAGTSPAMTVGWVALAL